MARLVRSILPPRHAKPVFGVLSAHLCLHGIAAAFGVVGPREPLRLLLLSRSADTGSRSGAGVARTGSGPCRAKTRLGTVAIFQVGGRH